MNYLQVNCPKIILHIPSDWKEDNSINEVADLQASKEKETSYFVLITDYKNDYNYTFEVWKENVFTDFLEDVENIEESDEVKVTINGRYAIQQTISGVYEDVKVKLLLTYVDGLNYYGQIICTSNESYYEGSLSSFKVITYSVKGL